MSLIIGKDLEESIKNLEDLIAEEKKEYDKCPKIMGYEEHFYHRLERIHEYRVIQGYLKELQEYRQGKHV